MRVTTAGESHGKGLFAILEGVPAGLKLDIGAIDAALSRRQSGYGRGARQKIEADAVELYSGVRDLVTLGSPIAIAVLNRDYAAWKEVLAPEGCDTEKRRLTAVRPGHADLAGMRKFGASDARDILERASARETAIRVAAGEICRQYLAAFGIKITGYVAAVGSVRDTDIYTFSEIERGRRAALGMMSPEREAAAMREIDACTAAGDTLGGVAEVRVLGLKAGFGSCMTYEEKLDARLAGALMGIQAVKGVEFGAGFEAAHLRGSEVHDEIFHTPSRGFYRKTNRAGGIEGGMSNGEEIVLRLAMKPIPTLMRGLETVDTATYAPSIAAAERSDVCAICALETIAESVTATVLATAVAERLGGDTMKEAVRRYGELQ